MVAALLIPRSSVVIQYVGLNPSRTALLDFLVSMGASIQLQNLSSQSGELVGDIHVRASAVRGGTIEKGLTAALIDEIPILAVLGAASRDGLLVRDARELRLKESDRIATVAENLRRMGVGVEVQEAGFFVPGRQNLRAAELDSFGDHRIAMTFAVAALRSDGECRIEGAEAAAVSFPEVYEMMHQLTR
jgi:3-phosphoshikimate 1-carboxyvinyltransferase